MYNNSIPSPGGYYYSQAPQPQRPSGGGGLESVLGAVKEMFGGASSSAPAGYAPPYYAHGPAAPQPAATYGVPSQPATPYAQPGAAPPPGSFQAAYGGAYAHQMYAQHQAQAQQYAQHQAQPQAYAQPQPFPQPGAQPRAPYAPQPPPAGFAFAAPQAAVERLAPPAPIGAPPAERLSHLSQVVSNHLSIISSTKSKLKQAMWAEGRKFACGRPDRRPRGGGIIDTFRADAAMQALKAHETQELLPAIANCRDLLTSPEIQSNMHQIRDRFDLAANVLGLTPVLDIGSVITNGAQFMDKLNAHEKKVLALHQVAHAGALLLDVRGGSEAASRCHRLARCAPSTP